MAVSPPSAERSTMAAGATPRVSVIMPVYNAERYVAEAIESVLAQTMGDFEFLIHDDGSTDGSAAIVQSYAARDPRISFSSGENSGVAAALNTLVLRARAPWLARMDADDVCLPERFAQQLARLEAEPDLVVLGTAAITIDGEGRRIVHNFPPRDHEAIDGGNLRGMCQIEHPSVMISTAALAKVGGYDALAHNGQDIDLWLRLAEVGRLANSADIGILYRLHEGSVSSRRAEEQMANCRRACEAAWARRGLTGVSFDLKPWRMGADRSSRSDFYRRYGWQAWVHGYRSTWLHYALQALRMKPFAVDNWKLLVMGALRRPEAKQATP